VSAELLAALLGVGGLGAIIAAVVTGLFSKRKLGAEATEIITKAAAGVVTNMQAEIDRQVRRNSELITEHRAALERIVSDHATEMAEVRRVLGLHVAWDGIAIARLAELGITLPPAPPLLHLVDSDHPSN
jgi:hypothetical protein